VDIWISTEGTPYIRQMEIDATSNGQATKGTMRWLNFNEDFDITAPPVTSP
jgi:hypothetical protein